MLTILIHYLLLLFYLSLWKCITIHEPPWSTHSVFCLRLKYILAHCEVLVWSKNWVKKNKMLHSVIMCECNKLGMFFFHLVEVVWLFAFDLSLNPMCSSIKNSNAKLSHTLPQKGCLFKQKPTTFLHTPFWYITRVITHR